MPNCHNGEGITVVPTHEHLWIQMLWGGVGGLPNNMAHNSVETSTTFCLNGELEQAVNRFALSHSCSLN